MLQRVYISTWTLQRVAQAGRHTGTHPFPAVGWRGRFFSFSLQSKQHRVLQAPNQTACSRVNRIWGVVMGTRYYRCKTVDNFHSRAVNQVMSTWMQRQFTLPVPGRMNKSQRGSQRTYIVYEIVPSRGWVCQLKLRAT